jgi:hypothetical protein
MCSMLIPGCPVQKGDMRSDHCMQADIEAVEVARGVYSREELELRDLERAMEEQLVAQHSQVHMWVWVSAGVHTFLPIDAACTQSSC